MSDSTNDGQGAAEDPRALRRAEKAARRAQRAQEKADKARREALDAVRASGFDVNDPASEEPQGGASRDSGEDTDSNADTDTSTAETKESGTGATVAAPAGSASSHKDEPSAKDAKGSKDTQDGGAAAKRDAGPATGKKARSASSEKTKTTKEGNPKLAAAILALAAVLAVVAVVSWVGYGSQRDAVANEQAETNAPADAAEAARAIVTNMFTYDSDAVDEQLGRVEPMLTGDAEQEFRETTRPQVSSLAKETEANSYATVAAVGVEERVDADHVVTVMMLNRMVSTKDNPEAQNSSTRLRVSVDRVDDGGEKVWKISKVEVL